MRYRSERAVYHLCNALAEGVAMAIADQAHTTIQTLHDRRLARRMEDPKFRREFERVAAEIKAVDGIVNALDHLRAERGMSKAQLAREIDKNPSSVRRLFTLDGVNPELRTVVAMANALGADLCLVPRADT